MSKEADGSARSGCCGIPVPKVTLQIALLLSALGLAVLSLAFMRVWGSFSTISWV